LQNFIVGNDEYRVEIAIATGNGLFEEHRAAQVVDCVVDESGKRPALDHHFGAKAIANFDADLVGVDDQVAGR
jgi:hypothetical protein